MDINTIMSFGLNEAQAKQVLDKIQQHITSKIETEVNKAKLLYKDEIAKIKLDIYVENELRLAGARNVKATLALIDFNLIDKQKVDTDAIKKMIDELKLNEETKFLFLQDKALNKFKGNLPFESVVNKPKISKNMNYEQLCKYYENNNIL